VDVSVYAEASSSYDEVMQGDVDIAAVAALMGEPARATVLLTLSSGRALAASTLAQEAGVANSTLSGHLGRLVDGGMITVEASGRHRYYRLASPEIAEAVEALARIAPPQQVRSLRQATHAEAIRRARSCYDHLAGRLGVELCEALVSAHVVGVESSGDGPRDPVLGAGRAKRFAITMTGRDVLSSVGVCLDPPTRRPLVRYCVDWSEQRPHLSGWLGAALLARFIELGWVSRGERRVVRVNASGRSALPERLGVDLTWLPG
jgi:DNA-binding transcriptional ArsR family regulator